MGDADLHLLIFLCFSGAAASEIFSVFGEKHTGIILFGSNYIERRERNFSNIQYLVRGPVLAENSEFNRDRRESQCCTAVWK